MGDKFNDIEGINALSKEEVVELIAIEAGIRKTFLQVLFKQMSDVDSETSQLMRGDFTKIYQRYLATAQE